MCGWVLAFVLWCFAVIGGFGVVRLLVLVAWLIGYYVSCCCIMVVIVAVYLYFWYLFC